HDAGRAEHAEAAIVRFVCGEAGERAVFFRSDDAERAGAFEAPDLSEVLFDEFEDSGAAAASAAEVSRDPGARSGRRSTVYVPCPRFFDESALRKKCARSFILREHSRHEVVARLRENHARVRVGDERASDAAAPRVA